MTLPSIVVGIGQPMAGDDGVGLAVARLLAARGCVTCESTDASIVVSLLETERRVVVVDAVVGGGPAGSIVRLDPGNLATGPAPLSSHGIGVAAAIELARTLYGDRATARVAIVGIAIDRPTHRPVSGLSPAVAAAVEPAAMLAANLALEDDDVSRDSR